MKHNRVIYLFAFAALIAVTLFVISSVQATANISTTREARAEQADILRWQALGEYYLGQPVSASILDASLIRDVNAARWQALGETYLAIAMQVRQVGAARWQALGEAYMKSHQVEVGR